MSTYTTVQGDMWDSIAYRELGSEAYTDKIMAMNPQYLDFITLPAGLVLQLPEATIPTAEDLPPWKQVAG